MKVLDVSTAWKCAGTEWSNGTFAILQTMADELTFDQWMSFDLIVAATQAHEENNETVTRDEIDDLILYDSPLCKVIEVVIQGFRFITKR
jgi:hypothetical protein